MFGHITVHLVLFAVPTRKAKHVARARKSNQPSPISKTELAQHVASQYVNGPNGVIKEQSARARSRDLVDPEESDQKEFLEKLDRHPALVLNADYQVRETVLWTLLRLYLSTHFKYLMMAHNSTHIASRSLFLIYHSQCGIGKKL